MVIIAIVAVGCFIAGVAASSRWLPAFESGPVGDVSFFVICGLSGALFALLGLHIYDLVRELETNPVRGLEATSAATELVSRNLVLILADCAPLAALTLVAFLLAPIPEREEAQPGDGETPAALS